MADYLLDTNHASKLMAREEPITASRRASSRTVGSLDYTSPINFPTNSSASNTE